MRTKDESVAWIMEYTYENRHHYLVHIWTMSKVFWQEPSIWHADCHKIHTFDASSKLKAILWQWMSGSSGTHNHYVFFCFSITQVGTGEEYTWWQHSDSRTMQDARMFNMQGTWKLCKTRLNLTCVLVTTHP